MNPELIATDAQLFVLVLACLGSGVVGFLFGFLSCHWGFNKRIEELEDMANYLKPKE